MTSRERLLAAIRHQVPDTVPVGIHGIGTFLGYLHQHVKAGMSDVEALDYFGFDPTYYRGYSKSEPSDDWRASEEVVEQSADYTIVQTTIKTPDGTLTTRYRRTPITTWQLDPLLKKPEDLELMRFQPESRVDAEAWRKEAAQIRGQGLIRTACDAPSNLMLWRTDEQFFLDLYERPDWVHQALDFITERAIRSLAGLSPEFVDLVELPGHVGTFLSPTMYEEFFLPYDKRIIDALHALGLPVSYHNCGRCKHQLPSVAKAGADCAETLTPPSHGGSVSLREAKELVGDQLCLIGGFDQKTLEFGTPQLVRDEVRRCIEEGAPGGGYILYNTDHFFEAPLENVHAMVQAAREFGAY